VADMTAFFLLGEIIEFDKTQLMFSTPKDKTDRGIYHRTVWLIVDKPSGFHYNKRRKFRMPRKYFDQKLADLNRSMKEMGAVVDRRIGETMEALKNLDKDLAAEVVGGGPGDQSGGA